MWFSFMLLSSGTRRKHAKSREWKYAFATLSVFFPFSWIVWVWVFPDHLVPEYQIIWSFSFRLVEEHSAPLTTLYYRFHPHICWRVCVHLLPLNIFKDTSLVPHSHFFFARCFSRCCAMVFTVFTMPFTCRKNSTLWNNWFNCWRNTIIWRISTIFIIIFLNLNGRSIFVVQVRIRRSPTFVISIFILFLFRCHFFW